MPLTPPSTLSLRHVMSLALVSLCLSALPISSSSASPSQTPPSQTPTRPNSVSTALESGPMLGFGGAREVSLWLRTTRPAVVELSYAPAQDKGGAPTEPTRLTLKTSGHDGRTLKHTLSGLTPNTLYRYTLKINGVPQERPYPFTFKTTPRWHRRAPAPDVVMAIGSCAYLNQYPDDSYGGEVEIFESVRAQRPDLMLWLGDAVYLNPEDWGSREGIFRRYASYRAHPALQPLLASAHHYATWDDHDYGPNDGNKSYPLKAESRAAFSEFWANPSYGLPELPGVFGQFSWSDVDVFLLDNRTYRSAGNAPPAYNSYLGDAQLTWLLDALSASRAPFKLIASGSQVISPYSRFESYAQHPHELARLLQGIKEREVEGVVFLSGDRHHAELNVLRDDPQFYPLYDFTSSPLTSRPASSSDDELNSPRRVPGTFVKGQRNFGVLRVQGAPGQRTLTMETRGVKGELLWSHTIKASELTIPR